MSIPSPYQTPQLPPATDFSSEGRCALNAFYRNRGANSDSEKMNALMAYSIKDTLISTHTLRQLEYFVLMQWGFDE